MNIATMTEAQMLAWQVQTRDAPRLPDDKFLLWWKEAQFTKLGTEEEWAAVRRRLTEISERDSA